jgi:hypothetical protein
VSSLNRSGVRFGERGSELDPKRIEVRIPAGIRTKRELLEVLDKGLSLPDYFGMNWDAFNEVIRDLSWLPPGQVVLVHSDVPLAGDPHNQGKYLAILSDATARWMNVKERDLLVTFPSEFQQEVEQHR